MVLWSQQNFCIIFFDDKMHVLNNGYDILALGYHS